MKVSPRRNKQVSLQGLAVPLDAKRKTPPTYIDQNPQSLLNGIPEPLAALNRTGTIVDASMRGEKRIGRSRKGLIGLSVDSPLVPKVHDKTTRPEAHAGVSHRLIEAQEQERARIARELHDDTSQRLATLVMNIEQLRDDLPEHAVELRNRVNHIRNHMLNLSNDIRTLAHELHPPGMEFLGLTGAARGFCTEFAEHQKVEVELKTNDVPSDLPTDISMCLFRILQEALHNSRKHSGVRRFIVHLWGTSDEVHLRVADGGAGFDVELAGKGPGLGLISMRERAKLLDGTFDIESHPKVGTTIHVCLPFRAEYDSISSAE
jgi:signal transduction histidine kinase